jgi:hypothetical protein
VILFHARGDRDRREFRNQVRAGGCIALGSCATAEPASDGLLIQTWPLEIFLGARGWLQPLI